jgi:heme-degrading monooxygenase HmoA
MGGNMFARITMFEIDMLRISLDEALVRFKQVVLPEVRKQDGYEGLYVLRTPEGKGCILSLWSSQEAAIAGEESGYYDEQVAKFVSFFKSPPGRDHYEVMFVDGRPEMS